MSVESALLNSLRERVADAETPDRQLFTDVWFTCSGKQSPNMKFHEPLTKPIVAR
ncbi:hypothetical protein [Methylobacterium oxalidis]|uniref:Uncharacterized protein n=1 Tax=Methylobacterium oxalidis TaxID=944322 RepID=A0A512JBV8_9HYPH|nr:hypothetical protein [Methylobacterium oxalidis]GEP07442.1 hypothetical protein MOX02_54800 [Methylobacterium oxalidis]GJE32575.1 hypothetical protein LDDCCGHA_2763 [Methylobacterium oxalidis]GLS63823.1 hypothetical protein GCM10007888_22040 [Methylobacterium oxalidis]